LCNTGQYLKELEWNGSVKGGIFLHKEVPHSKVQAHTVTTWDLWHGRLSHPSKQVLSLLAKDLDFSLDNKTNEPCDVWFPAKQTRCSFSQSESNASDNFELIPEF